MKNLITTLLIITSFNMSSQKWINDSNCDSQSYEILNEAITHLTNLEQLTALGMAKAAQMADSYERDYRQGITHTGPHRNDIDILVTGARARNVVSRGQAKLIASAITLAYCAELRHRSDILPILLLDDFGAELDGVHRERFFQELERIGCQVIATTTDEPKHLVGHTMAPLARVFHVEQGTISRYS